MSLSAQVIQRNVQPGPQTSARPSSLRPASAAEIDRRARVAPARLSGTPEVNRRRSSLGEYAARLYAAVAT
jgi:hypothetical protein